MTSSRLQTARLKTKRELFTSGEISIAQCKFGIIRGKLNQVFVKRSCILVVVQNDLVARVLGPNDVKHANDVDIILLTIRLNAHFPPVHNPQLPQPQQRSLSVQTLRKHLELSLIAKITN